MKVSSKDEKAQVIKRLIKKQDRYGAKINLTYKNENTYQTF